MIKHLFKMIWNRKKRNFLIIIEIFFSFIVLFAVGSMFFYGLKNYARPLGFSYKNVWDLKMRWGEDDTGRIEVIERILSEMHDFPEIKNLGWVSSNTPYTGNVWQSGIKVNGRSHRFYIFYGDDDLASVLDFDLIEGRWFSREDDASNAKPVVINRRFKEALFGSEPGAGKTYQGEKYEYIVVGVIEDYRYQGEFASAQNVVFERNTTWDPIEGVSHIIFSVREGTAVKFEENLMKKISSVAKDWTFNIEKLEDRRRSYFQGQLIPLAIGGLVAGFLVFNVALGLFGILWQSISRRRGEIGLRRAMGANSGQVSKLIWGETVVVATFGIILGAFAAIQVPIMGFFGSAGMGIYVSAILFSALLIYIIVSTCAVYPGYLASAIQPADALHDE